MGLQASAVHGLVSSQLSGVPATQAPDRHVSIPFQGLSSSHWLSDRHCGAATAIVAANASSRPAPAIVSKPGAPMSTAAVISAVLTCAGERNGFLLSRRAATAAT